MKVTKKQVSIICITYGLIDLVIFALFFSFFSTHMSVLGIISLVAGILLWSGHRWGSGLALLNGFLTLVVGTTTLYASIGFYGFSPNLDVLMLNVALIGYAMVAPTFTIFCLYGGNI